MFYSTQILSRKGALGTIWIASHMEKRLKRNQIFETSIPASVDSIINPEAPLALRLSGQLLLGVVRVYLRKLHYLQQDAEHAVEGLSKGTGQGGGAGVDLPDGGTAPEVAITLPDADPMVLFAAGAAADLFPTFEPDLLSIGGGVELGGGGRGLFQGGSDSLTVAEDISELFGSKWSGPGDDERFEVPDHIDRRFSIELERLRSAAGAEAVAKPGEGLFFQPPPGEEGYAPGPEDELMVAPPDDLFAIQPTAESGGATPASERPPGSLSAGAPLPGLSDIRITPPSLVGFDLLLPELGLGPATATTMSGGSRRSWGAAAGEGVERGAGGVPPPSAARRQQPRPRPRRRRAPVMDLDERGLPATELRAPDIRALLADRKPLLVPRGLRAGQEPVALAPQPYDVMAQVDASRGGIPAQPTAFATLAPELMSLFQPPLLPGGEPAATPASARRRGAAPEAAADAGAGAAAAAEGGEQPPPAEAEEEPWGPGSVGAPGSGLTSVGAGAADFSGGLPPPELEQQDWIEDSQQQELGPEGLPAGLSARRVSLTLEAAGGSLVQLGSLDLEPSDGSGPAAQQPRDAFTRNTRLVLGCLQAQFRPAPGSKRRHPSQGGLATDELSLDALVADKTRLDACRWFFEALVLKNKGYVELRQEEPYGDIAILPRPKLLDTTPSAVQ